MASDYRDVVTHKEKPDKKRIASGVARLRWWEVEGDEVANMVVEAGESLESDDDGRQAALIRHARLYENCEIDSLAGRIYSEGISRHLVHGTGFLSMNVGATCVDTITAKVTKNRPRPNFLTSGGSWAQQIKARNLDKWCKGFFYQTKVYQKSRQVFVDGLEFGTGFLQVFARDNEDKLECERVLPCELFVDSLDGQYGEPRQLMRTKQVSRDILIRLYPKFESEIIDAGKRQRVEDVHATPETVENTVQVWEAWHLPSGEGAKDGKHVICIDGAVLLTEKWNICKFPFVVYRFKKRTTGFWGKGVIESVQPIQLELNKGLRSVSQQMRRKGKGRTWVQIGSKVNIASMSNADGGDIGYYSGSPPIVDNGNAVASEDTRWIDYLYQKAFQEIGVSELSAAAKKPSGLDAAVALREYSDIESERFATQHQDWEQFFMDYADLSIDLITKQYGWKAYKVLVPGRRDLMEVDWASVDMERDSYIMQCFPVSTLPQTPSARYQKVKEMMQDGFIEKGVAQRLLEHPDVDAESNLANAMLDDADATISAILDKEEPELMPLEPYQNLDTIIQRANAAYLYARHRGCPEERLRLLRNLIDNATATKAQMMAPPMPPPMPGGEMSPPAPGAAPAGATQINNTLNAAAPTPAVAPLIAG